MSKKRSAKPEATEAPPPAPAPATPPPHFREDSVKQLLSLLKWDRRWALKNYLRNRLATAFDSLSTEDDLKAFATPTELHVALNEALKGLQYEGFALRHDLDEALRRRTGRGVTQQPAPAPVDQEPFETENPE